MWLLVVTCIRFANFVNSGSPISSNLSYWSWVNGLHDWAVQTNSLSSIESFSGSLDHDFSFKEKILISALVDGESALMHRKSFKKINSCFFVKPPHFKSGGKSCLSSNSNRSPCSDTATWRSSPTQFCRRTDSTGLRANFCNETTSHFELSLTTTSPVF